MEWGKHGYIKTFIIQWNYLRNTLKIFYDIESYIGLLIPDPRDIVLYAVLMEKRKEEEVYLVTENLKHFPVRTYIVTPREMLDILQEGLE